MAQNEDIPYNVSDHATEDPKTEDPDQKNKSVLVEVRAYLKSAIEEENTFDSLDLPQNATPEQKQAVFDEIAIHKGVAMHLRNVLALINDKVKELV